LLPHHRLKQNQIVKILASSMILSSTTQIEFWLAPAENIEESKNSTAFWPQDNSN
jgi:hypothetical protein